MSDEKTPDKGGTVRALVISHLYPSASNPVLGIFVHEQVKALRKLGVDARVVSFRPMYVSSKNPIRSLYAVYWSWSRRKAGTWLDYEGVPVIYVPYWIFPWGGEVSNTLSLLSALALHKKRIRQAFPFQLIHAHTAMLGGMGAQLLKFGSGIPVVLTEHTGPFHRLTDTPIKMFLTSRAISRADRVFAVSDSLGEAIVSSVPGTVVETIPNGTDTDRFSLQPCSKENRNIRMLWVGGADLVKRLDRLIEAFGIALRREPKLRLTIIGVDSWIDEMREHIDDYRLRGFISYLPRKNPSEMPTTYRECDFLVISSDTETFGVCAIEALSCGKPVLTTACGGPEEIITSDDLGTVVPRSTEALAEGMVELVSRIETFDPKRIRRHVVENFDITRVAQVLARMYANLVALKRDDESKSINAGTIKETLRKH